MIEIYSIEIENKITHNHVTYRTPAIKVDTDQTSQQTVDITLPRTSYGVFNIDSRMKLPCFKGTGSYNHARNPVKIRCHIFMLCTDVKYVRHIGINSGNIHICTHSSEKQTCETVPHCYQRRSIVDRLSHIKGAVSFRFSQGLLTLICNNSKLKADINFSFFSVA